MKRIDLPEVPTDSAALAAAIDKLIADVADPDATLGKESDGYGKCVEAMWRAGYLAHEMVAAKELYVSGFQHSISSLAIVGALRGLEGGYMLTSTDSAHFTQYDLVKELLTWLRSDEIRSQIADTATEELAKHTDPEWFNHEHLERLALDRPGADLQTRTEVKIRAAVPLEKPIRLARRKLPHQKKATPGMLVQTIELIVDLRTGRDALVRVEGRGRNILLNGEMGEPAIRTWIWGGDWGSLQMPSELIEFLRPTVRKLLARHALYAAINDVTVPR